MDEKEAELHAGAHDEVRPSLKGKRLLLFREMLESVGFPMAGDVVLAMAKGFPLVGDLPATGVFEERCK